MTSPIAGAQATAELSLTKSEADLVVEALHILMNHRRFGVLEIDEDVHQTHRTLFELAARARAWNKSAFNAK